ncbi:protein cholesin isoform X7 [Callorhinus ursinus]|uniref:protein cholesin isoform X7 n=1 Tax=Callorhinus ursinus TaxID=34884 RepID=UPI003CD01972
MWVLSFLLVEVIICSTEHFELDGKTEEKSYRNDREKEQKIEEGIHRRDPAGTSSRVGHRASTPRGRSSVGGQAGAGPPAARTDPGREEGPGEEAEEGAEERGEEVAAGVRSSPEPAGQALRGPAGPGLPLWVPDALFSTLLAYLEGLRGRARELTVQKAEALMQEVDKASGAEPFPLGKTQRIRRVLQLLS